MKKLFAAICGLSLCCSIVDAMSTPTRQELSVAKKSPTRTICNPTYDLTFKRVFGENTEDGKKRTINFLNSLLGLGIVNLTFEPTIEESDRYNKKIIFDILCRCGCRQNGLDYSIDIEVQKSRQGFYFDRSLFYGSTLLAKQSVPSQPYQEIPKAIVLTFLDCVFQEHAEPIFSGRMIKSPFQMTDQSSITPYVLSDKIELHYFQLPLIGARLRDKIDIQNAAFDQTAINWLSILSCKYISKSNSDDNIPIDTSLMENNSELRNAVDILEEYKTGELHAIFLAEQRDVEKGLRDKASEEFEKQEQIQKARDEGLQHGLQHGLQQGLIRNNFRVFKRAYIASTDGKVRFSFSKRLLGVSRELVEQSLLKANKDGVYDAFMAAIKCIQQTTDDSYALID